MIGFEVSINDTATPAFERLQKGLTVARVGPIIGRSARNTVRSHLLGLDATRPNGLGGSRTHYFGAAARATSFAIVGEKVVVSIAQVGMALHYFGGTVKPKTAKYLTIPVAPEAHGKRAREFDLELVFGAGGQPIALATKSTRSVQFTQNSKGKTVKKSIGRTGVIMFRLVRQANIGADETVIPHLELINEQARKEVNAYVGRLWQRQEERGDS
jgi:hypothetical protein